MCDKFLCDRIHLQHRVEDEEQCRLLIRDLQAQIQQAYTADIQDKDVLHENYIRRVLHHRKVTMNNPLSQAYQRNMVLDDVRPFEF